MGQKLDFFLNFMENFLYSTKNMFRNRIEASKYSQNGPKHK